jgi:hypothetical protein
VPEKDMVDIARKRAKVKPNFVSQSAGERELALQYIGELKQQRGSGADSLHCKICSPVRTFTAPTTLLSHYRSHAGKIIEASNIRSSNYCMSIKSNYLFFRD